MRPRYNIAIVGGGVIGCSVARALSRYRLDIALLEKGPDVASAASKANSAVVHAGYLNPPGSLKARLCVKGNRMFESFAGELGVPFRRTGKLVVARDEEELEELKKLNRQGRINSVPGLRIIAKGEIKRLEPNIRAEHAMLSANSGITNPILLTIALAENAHKNGVDFFLSTEVEAIDARNNGFILTTNRGKVMCEHIINCAGLHSDRIAGMAGDHRYRIHPCRGEYFVLDKAYSHLITRMIYPIPPKEKGVVGVHLTPTIEGNILIGPTAEFIEHKDDLATTGPMMKTLLLEAKGLLPGLPLNAVIQGFSGIRSRITDEKSGDIGDFIIEESRHVPGLINLIGIESPGLTCAPSIPRLVADILSGLRRLKKKENYDPHRTAVERFATLDAPGKARLVEQNPDHGHIVCRCEHVTRSEVIEALDNPLGVRTLDSVKMRTRATMGRCQGGFCLPRIVEIMEEKGMDPTDLTLKGGRSRLFSGRVRDE
ncbi:MAG: NAD(P)/FAD-dependent oxidoreductase [Thermoplasmata archaeon]|nr:NAD(P)/FAD-dependent oxidoreductase [Thermoplasmata archaeon]